MAGPTDPDCAIANCAIALMGGPGPLPSAEIGGLPDSAHELATNDKTRRAIAANRAVLDEVAGVVVMFAVFGVVDNARARRGGPR